LGLLEVSETNHKLAEQAATSLLDNADMFERLLDDSGLPVLVFSTDMHGNLTDWRRKSIGQALFLRHLSRIGKLLCHVT
jgi:hypothetical protein